jgi:hypothetical protein
LLVLPPPLHVTARQLAAAIAVMESQQQTNKQQFALAIVSIATLTRTTNKS